MNKKSFCEELQVYFSGDNDSYMYVKSTREQRTEAFLSRFLVRIVDGGWNSSCIWLVFECTNRSVHFIRMHPSRQLHVQS